MSNATTECWEERIGPRGATVRVGETTPGGKILLRWTHPERSGYARRRLDFRVRTSGDAEPDERAKQAARNEAREVSDLLALGLLPDEAREPEPVTFGELFDRYREYELEAKDGQWRRSIRRVLEAMERFLGREMRVEDLSPSDWKGFVRARTSGRIDARGRTVPPKERTEVSPGTTGYDLRILKQVCAWGTGHRPRDRKLPDDRRFLLDFDPTRDNRMRVPKEKNVSRPKCSDERFRQLLKASEDVLVGRGNPENKSRAPLRELLILTRGTGARIGAVCRLRWSDWDPEPRKHARHGTLRFRKENDKEGKEKEVPVIRPVREVLEGLREKRLAESGVPGPESWIFPAPESDGHLRPDVTRNWLLEAEEAAGLDHPDQFGWHSMRRAWASARRGLPLKDVAKAGGWDSPGVVEESYLRDDPETVERVVLHEETLPGLEEEADAA